MPVAETSGNEAIGGSFACGRTAGLRPARWCRYLCRSLSAAFELRDEEDLAAVAELLEIGRLVVDLAVDRDGGFLDEMIAEARIRRSSSMITSRIVVASMSNSRAPPV